ncbi:protein phosphatase [Streptomyces sp. WMMB 322]|nr:protein phosphatase [Streptomyces sp. WMMB 322]
MRMYPEPTGEVRMSLSLRFAAGSHDGMIRDHNEDSGYAGPRLLAVADGMGGQAAGEVASSEVISTIVQLDEDIPGSDLLTSLGVAVQRANDQLRGMVEEDPQLEGMGTTLTALLWTGRRLGLVHVGDSRAYLLRDGQLTQITQDHTWVQKLVDEGRITEEEATTHPQRSLLMRALGSSDHVEPDLSIREVRAGDRYLICSDGLPTVVSPQTIEEALASYQGPQETVHELIQLALRGGGPDNITCIVADVVDVDENDALGRQLNDTPVVVGAVAESQTPLGGDLGAARTPAARAAELGRTAGQSVPSQNPGESFGPPGSGNMGDGPDGGFGRYTEEDFVKRRGGRRWLRRSLWLTMILIIVGGGLYGGYRWTQTQYYVGANDDHIALYRGISQELAGLSLNEVYQDRPGVELKYLPGYQRNQVRETIASSSIGEARDKADELEEQAKVCRIIAEQPAEPPADKNKKKDEQSKQGDAEKNSADADKNSAENKDPSDSPSPSQSPKLSEKQQQLARQCTAP